MLCGWHTWSTRKQSYLKGTVLLLLFEYFVSDSLPILCIIPSLVFIFAASRTVQKKGGFVVVIVWLLDLQLPMQSVPITKIVSLNPVHGKVYSIQHYVIQFVSDLRQVGGFLWVLQFHPLSKTDCQDINEILLKVVLNTINQTKLINNCSKCHIFWII